MSQYNPALPTGFTPTNKQARATVGILNTVRMVGTLSYVAIAVLMLVAALITIVTDDNGIAIAIGLGAAAVVTLIAAALFYAVVGWFVDTLALLKQIADNTHPATI